VLPVLPETSPTSREVPTPRSSIYQDHHSIMSFQVFISTLLYTKLSYAIAINPAQISGQAGDRIVDFGGTRTIMLKNVTQPFGPLFMDVSPTNTTYLPISVQSGLAADVTYHCDDDLYGTPTRGACFDAYDSIPMTDHVTFFGDRSNPGPVPEVPMPWRTTSCKSLYSHMKRGRKMKAKH